MTTFPQLKPDIWLNIFEVLRGPLPAPQCHSTLPDSPLSSIRQPDLASCLRLNKTICNLASRVLYEIVVTDSLLGLVSGIDNSPIPGAVSKLELLGTTRKLMLEYAYKGEGEGVINERTAQELKDLSGAWRVILEWQGSLIFLELGTLAIGAVFGTVNDLIQYDAIPSTLEYPDTRKPLRRFLTTSPTIHHFCQTVSNGCLSLFPARPFHGQTHPPKWDTAKLPSIAIHTYIGFPVQLPIAAGTKTRWYVHNNTRLNWVYRVSITELLRQAIARALHDRSIETTCFPPRDWARLDWSLDAEIYISLAPHGQYTLAGNGSGSLMCQDVEDEEVGPSTDEDRMAWEKKAQDLGDMGVKDSSHCAEGRLQMYMPGQPEESPTVKVEDHWKVSQLFQAPPCEACLWRYEGRGSE